MPSSLFLHLGYPKTATTTLQRHLYSRHPDIHYLGKFIPGYGYSDERMGAWLNQMISEQSHSYDGGHELGGIVRHKVASSDRACTLLSSETFIHPWAIDIATVAQRARDAFFPCKVLIVIREQRDILWSFYRAHGCYGQYLYVQPENTHELLDLRAPVSVNQWLDLQERQLQHNFSATLMYGSVIESYAKVFGKENVLVLCYEEMKDNLSGFVKKLSSWMKIDGVVAENLIADHRENESAMSVDELPYLTGEELRRSFYAAIPETLLSLYRAENAKLIRNLDLDIHNYGYIL